MTAEQIRIEAMKLVIQAFPNETDISRLIEAAKEMEKFISWTIPGS